MTEAMLLPALADGESARQLDYWKHALGDELDALHTSVHEHLWSVFRMRVALLIVVSFLERHRGHFEPATLQGVPELAH